MNKVLITFLLCLVPWAMPGAEIPEACQKQVAQFLAALKSGNADQAITGFMQDKLKWGGRDEMRQMVSSLQGLTEDVIGKYTGDEIIYSEQIARDYVVLVVMVKYERQPMFFKFGFYRPKNEFVGDTINMKSNVMETRMERLNLRPLPERGSREAPNSAVP
jgi:hypothetical protein